MSEAACLDELLPDYQGNLQTDAYAGYAAWAHGRDGIALASCWARSQPSPERREHRELVWRLPSRLQFLAAPLQQGKANPARCVWNAEAAADVVRFIQSPLRVAAGVDLAQGVDVDVGINLRRFHALVAEH